MDEFFVVRCWDKIWSLVVMMVTGCQDSRCQRDFFVEMLICERPKAHRNAEA